MKYYIEMTLLPGVDIGISFLWEKVFDKLHSGLVEIKDSDHRVPIGVSFPDYDMEKNRLGQKLRLFSQDEAMLKKLNAPKLFRYFDDYIHLKRARLVPKTAKYAIYQRKQEKGKVQIAKRIEKREGIDFEKALKNPKKCKKRNVDAPFIYVNSQSTGERFKLFIVRKNGVAGDKKSFSCYALDPKSSVPEF